jgi:hypothetical protein
MSCDAGFPVAPDCGSALALEADLTLAADVTLAPDLALVADRTLVDDFRGLTARDVPLAFGRLRTLLVGSGDMVHAPVRRDPALEMSDRAWNSPGTPLINAP